LENALERAAILSEDGRIAPEHLPAPIGGRRTRLGGRRSLAEAEREHIDTVLKECGGNKSQAARILGVSPTTLWRKLTAWERAAAQEPAAGS
jgi:DNA-binding NtrC family response regulator